eukprot:SAG11_NODE_799_length_7127_cov_3.180279_10_plen_190_part_00
MEAELRSVCLLSTFPVPPLSSHRCLHCYLGPKRLAAASFLTDELVAAYLEIEGAKLSAENGGGGALESTLASIPGLADSDEMLDDLGDDELAERSASLAELEARQRTIRSEIVRLGGTAAELRLQQALDQYSSSQQAANAQLAHEIILNPDLQLLPARDPDLLRGTIARCVCVLCGLRGGRQESAQIAP